MPVTVLGADGTGQDSDIIEGVVYAADHDADVILMSFSNPGYSELLQAAVDYAWDERRRARRGDRERRLVCPQFPAGDRGVIGVSNTDQSDALNGSSNYGQDVFLGAPGTGIATTSAGGGYASITGTSASAAEVAGAAALIMAKSGASNGVIVSRLAKNAERAGTTEQTGNGRLNLDRAITDTSTGSIQPAGAAPVGGGGPIVGPYVAATTNIASATIEARESTCVTAQGSFASGSTVCAHSSVTGTAGGGGAGSFFVEWTDPSSTVVRTTTFTVPATVPMPFDDTFAPVTVGTWTLSVCKTEGCSGGNLVASTTFAVVATRTITFSETGIPASDAGATNVLSVTVELVDDQLQRCRLPGHSNRCTRNGRHLHLQQSDREYDGR